MKILLCAFLSIFTPLIPKSAKINYAQSPSVGATDSRVSGNGRFTVFQSDAGNVIPIVTSCSSCSQIYMKDNSNDNVYLISQNQNGETGDGDSKKADISYDGRYIIFLSKARNLLNINDDNYHLYLLDQSMNQMVIVDKYQDNIGNGSVVHARISGNGEAITFISNSSNLGVNSYSNQVYYYNIKNNFFRVITKGTDGAGNGDSSNCQISYDGAKVVFQSKANNLDKSATFYANYDNIFYYQVVSNKLQLVSRDENNFSSLGDSISPGINDEGEIIYYASNGTNIVTAKDGQKKIIEYTHSTKTNKEIYLGNNISEIDELVVSGRGDKVVYSAKVKDIDNRQILIYEKKYQKSVVISVDNQATALYTINHQPALSNDGIYFSFTATDYMNSKVITQKIDVLPPLISYIGNSEVVVGTEFDFLSGIVVYDYHCQQVSFYLSDSGGFDINTVGTYTIKINAVDDYGNFSEFSYQIFVIEESYPLYLGPKKINIRVNDRMDKVMSKFKFVDKNNNPLEAYFVDKGNLDTTILGKYTVVVGASNKFGKETQVTINVKVVRTVIGDFSTITLFIIPIALIGLAFLILKIEIKEKKKKDKKRIFSPIPKSADKKVGFSKYWH